ncbi:MAG: hypothetical protein IJF65_05470 [Clostridia bacterium]|nr:hypothetical protein [Clostridia bacterium]
MAKKKRKIVHKPFQKGAPADSNLLRRSLGVAGSVLVSCLLYLFLGTILVFDQMLLRLVANLLLIAGASVLIYFSGLNTGVSDVTFGEIIHRRIENGQSPERRELARCYHPFKGFLCGLAGVSPFLIICLALAFTTQMQTFTLGVLPDWVASFERRPEIGAALQYYHREIPMGVIDYLRLIVRVIMMPYMNIVGSSNALGMLWLERLSPLLCLIPAIAYGLGYQGGVNVRAQVHTDIAAAKRKQKRREARQMTARKSNEPERLN